MVKTPPYSEWFRREAVQLLRRGERSIPQVAQDLGLTSDERDKLKRLRNPELRAMNLQVRDAAQQQLADLEAMMPDWNIRD